MNNKKIFCIGWHKTGTTTIGDAFLKLGYSVVGARLDLTESLQDGKLETALKIADDFDVLQDVPWNSLFKELDQGFPNSKFILTVRDPEKWLNSAIKHFGNTHCEMHAYLYGKGVVNGNEQLYLERYKKHNAEVLEYFKDRPDDLLIMDLSKGHAWEELCGFLGIKIPKKPFPHSNKGKHSLTKRDKFILKLKDLLPMGLRKYRMKVLGKLGKDPRHRFNNRVQNEEVRRQMRNRK